jgi:hypothetical protein
MDTIGTARAHSTQQNMLQHPGIQDGDEIRPITPVSEGHEHSAVDPATVAVSSLLNHHFNPHLKAAKPAPRNASQEELNAIDHARTRNAELAEIRYHRTQWLVAQGETPADMAAVEKTAERFDALSTVIKSNIGGWAFGLATIATNEKPQALEIFEAPKDPGAHNALTNAVSCIIASLSDNTSNDVFAGFKPGKFQKPTDEELHGALQASLMDIRTKLDKGMLREAEKGGRDWFNFFIARNFSILPMTVTLTHMGDAALSAKIENTLRPVTAVGMGVGINLLNDSRDRNNHLAGPAMIYGLRDAPDADGNRPAIADEQKWKDTYMALKQLNTSKVMRMIPKRAGEGVATMLKSLISGDAIKANATPAAIGGAIALAGGFALMGAATTYTRQLAEKHNLEPWQASLAAETVKNTLGALAFDFWFMGAYLAEALTNKATAAIDAHVGRGVQRGLDAAVETRVAQTAARGADVVGHAVAETSRYSGRKYDEVTEYGGRKYEEGKDYSGRKLGELRNGTSTALANTAVRARTLRTDLNTRLDQFRNPPPPAPIIPLTAVTTQALATTSNPVPPTVASSSTAVPPPPPAHDQDADDRV